MQCETTYQDLRTHTHTYRCWSAGSDPFCCHACVCPAGGAGAYAAVDAVGGHSTGNVVSATRDGGTVLVYGVLESVQATISIPDLFAR